MNLFRLDPIGLGTESVESFSSYMVRLAAVHGVSLLRFLEHLRAVDAKAEQPLSLYANTTVRPWSLCSMVRPTDTTEDLVNLISHYTGRTDLRATTFLALKEMRYRSVDLFSNVMKWCPSCFEDDISCGRDAYHRLIWSCQEVEYCHIHNMRLESKCPYCCTKQNGMARHFRMDSCRRCKEPLTAEKTPMSASQLTEDVCFRDLIALVCAISGDPDTLYQPMDSVLLLEKIFEKAWQLNDEREFWNLLPRDESLAIVTMNKPVTVKKLRRVAYRLGISFPGLLAGEVQCWTAQLNASWLEDLPANMQPIRRPGWSDRNELFDRLTSTIKASDVNSPPPLAHIATVVGVSTGALEYHFPEICKSVKKRYQDWMKRDQERKFLEATVRVWEYLNNPDPHKSRKHALKVIRADSDLPKNILREVIAQEFSR